MFRRHQLNDKRLIMCKPASAVEKPGRRGKKNLHRPGIEPGSQEWESCMIPLHQRCQRLAFSRRLWKRNCIDIVVMALERSVWYLMTLSFTKII